MASTIGLKCFSTVFSGAGSPLSRRATCSLRSCPTQNALPAPVRTTARTDGSAPASVRAPSSCSLRVTDREFIDAGRFSVIVVTAPARSTRIASSPVLSVPAIRDLQIHAGH
jgi:hypothetical protein